MSVKLKFGYNVAGLTAYVDQTSQQLLVRSIFEGKTASKFQKQTGIKSSEALQLLSTDVVFQTGGTCAPTASGTTTFTQRNLTVGKVNVTESLCPKELEAYWTQQSLVAGSVYDAISFESDYTNLKASVIAEANETALWQGNTSTGIGNNAFFNGFVKIVDDASAVTISGNTGGVTSGTGITASNIIAILDAMWLRLPAALKSKADVEFMVGSDTFDKLVMALRAANLFWYNGVDGAAMANGELILAGTPYKVSRYFGLDSTNRILLGRTSNFFIGTDLESDEDNFQIKVLETDNIRFKIDFKLGTQIAYPNEVVQFKLV
jgi:hypothetical protein